MVLHFKGAYKNNNEKLPHEEWKKHNNANRFKEFNNAKLFLILINLSSIILLGITAFIYHNLVGLKNVSICGVMFVIASLIPHEIIHAAFFRGDVYLYLHHLALLITGTEPMSKKRYIMMCLLPTIVFGFIPFVCFLINPTLRILGTLGAISIPLGLGDFYNIYNCAKQVPKDGICFMDKQNTCWYIPNNNDDKPNWDWNKTSMGSSINLIIAVVLSFFILLFGLINVENIVFISLFLMVEITMYCLLGYFQIKFNE